MKKNKFYKSDTTLCYSRYTGPGREENGKGLRSQRSLDDMIWKAGRKRGSRLRWHSVRRQNLRQEEANTDFESRQQCD